MEKVNATKILIGDSFKKLALKKSIGKISVQDVLNDCRVNRTTFYYYFQSKQDVIAWVFRWGISIELTAVFRPDDLICQSGLGFDHHDGLPFYVLQENRPGDDGLLKEFWNVLASHLDNNAAYYSNAFRNVSYDDLGTYVFWLYQSQVKRELLARLRELAAGRRIPEKTLDLISIFITNSTIGWLISQLKRSAKPHRIVTPGVEPISLYRRLVDSLLEHYLEQPEAPPPRTTGAPFR